MRRLIVNCLAIVGALVCVAVISGFVLKLAVGGDHVVVQDTGGSPLTKVPVFLDRGSSAIERYVTDAKGSIRFPLSDPELARAVWLLCAPGAIPMVGRRDLETAGPITYSVTALGDSTWGWYRANGWRGPIPRECPRGTDSMGWRPPPSAGQSKYAFSATEPVWPK